MSKSDKKIILPDDPEAATYRTDICGWVDRHGRFHGTNESWARRSGATHLKCSECGEFYSSHAYCHPCSERKRRERFLALPMREWKGEPVCLPDGDEFFFDPSSFYEYCDSRFVAPQEVDLVFAEPQYAIEIDPQDHYADDLPEGADLPKAIIDAFDALNEAIRACRDPLCWYPDDVRVDPASIDNTQADQAKQAEGK